MDEVERARNRSNSKVRAKVEHPIGVIKRGFGFANCAIAGSKRTHRRVVTYALVNLFMVRRHLLRRQPA